MRTRPRRLLFFAFETILLAVASLGVAADLLQRKIYDPRVVLILDGLSLVSFVALPIWCLVYRAREPKLARVGLITLAGLIGLTFVTEFVHEFVRR